MQLFFVTIIGLVIGSFLTALLHRLQTGASIANDRSRCPHCDAVLSWYELIPLLSFAVQRGCCRHCEKRISWQYPAIVASTAVVVVVASLRVGVCQDLQCGGSFAMVAFWGVLLLAIAVYDLRWMLIPDELIVVGSIVAIAAAPFWNAPDTWHAFAVDGLAVYVFGLIIAGGFLLLLFLGSRGRAMGFGDVKLAALLGFLVGWQQALVLLVLAFVVGGIVGGVLLLTRRASRRSKIPFGPYLAGAGFVVLMWGAEIVQWYLSFAKL